MIELSEQLQNAVANVGATPLTLIDPQTKREYVLLSQEEYEQLLRVQQEWQPREAYSAMNRMSAQGGWDDPEMDVYDQD